MYRVKVLCLSLIIVSLLSTGIWSGCRASSTPPGAATAKEPPLTATASADIVIVEKSSPRLAQIQPVPTNIVLSPGETIGLSAIPFDQEGRELKQVTINWQAADPRAGTVTPSGVFRAGFTKGHFQDALVVTARAPAGLGSAIVQATASVTVGEFSGQLRPVSIRVFPEAKEVQPLESVELMALAMDANGVAIPNMKFKWEMLEPLAGSMSPVGRWTASANLGTFLSAIKVTLIPDETDISDPISASLDVLIVDAGSLSQQISATALPQVISLRPAETIRFTTMVLDKAGNQISPLDALWETLDAGAGRISLDGNFIAGREPGIYPDAVRVSMKVPGVDEKLFATGTVIIVDPTPPEFPATRQGLPRVFVFPERIVLSPGESARVFIVSPDGDVQGLTSTNVSWSLVPPEVGEVSQFVTVTAHDSPGIYEGAIRAKVTLEGETGPVVQEVSATLVIRGRLANVDVTPQVATMAQGERMQFRAVAYDKNDVMLPDVSFRWSVSEPAVGNIDGIGLFTAKGLPGKYPGGVQVEAVQR